jgi:hypothetical protein
MGVMSQNFSEYVEDIAVVAPGSTVVSQPCRVYSMTFSIEGAGDAVISVSNSQGYDNAYRVEKVVLTSTNKTFEIIYPTGKFFSSGVSAISNLGSVDVGVTFE